jgi:flavodoxin
MIRFIIEQNRKWKLKRILIGFIILMSIIMITWADSTNDQDTKINFSQNDELHGQNTETDHVLVAYFSHSGNTRTIANKIHACIRSDLFEIKAVDPYPEDYETVQSVAMKELSEGYRPKLATHVENIDSYDVVFLGYPNWWGTMPMAVETFLIEHDLSGKTIVPFCTHDMSGFGSSITDIKNLCPTATLLDGLAVRGSDANDAQSQVEEWIDSLGINQE